MKLTESKLRQIIREEAQRMFEYDDADEFPPGTPSYGPDTDHLRPRHDYGTKPVAVGQYREFPGSLTPRGVEDPVGVVISIKGDFVQIGWTDGTTSYLPVSEVEQNSECTY
jgi:hypothetical protein